LTAWNPIVIPEHALLILEERLREQQAEGVRMPEGRPLGELALRILLLPRLLRSPIWRVAIWGIDPLTAGN
jgi:hypothetical protein